MPDGVHFVFGLSAGDVRMYHVDGTLVHTFFEGGCSSIVERVTAAVTPDGQHIISGSADIARQGVERRQQEPCEHLRRHEWLD